MRRLLLVTHRSIDQDGGPAARWRAFARYLPENGWEVDVLSATQRPGAAEFEARALRAVARRAAVMEHLARLSEPAFRRAGVQTSALPLSMLWIPRGALLVRRRIAERRPDVLLASGPPFAGPLAARLGVTRGVPLIVELRDLWAANPLFDAGGRTLPTIEGWLLRGARRVVACTPEAVSDLRARHPNLGQRVVGIANGFDPEIGSIVSTSHAPRVTVDGHRPGRMLTLLHSGTLTPDRPIAPIVRALEDARLKDGFRLVLHGYMSPAMRREIGRLRAVSTVPIEVLPPSPWAQAIRRIADADACIISQAHAAGDSTAIASKIYEYLALGKPVLCVTDGGASEALLHRLRADQLCARLDSDETIVAALLRLRDGAARPAPPERLRRYSRRALASRMAALLEEVASD